MQNERQIREALGDDVSMFLTSKISPYEVQTSVCTKIYAINLCASRISLEAVMRLNLCDASLCFFIFSILSRNLSCKTLLTVVLAQIRSLTASWPSLLSHSSS